MIKNILIIIISATVLYALWVIGLENVYAYCLKFGTNALLIFFDKNHTDLLFDKASPTFLLYFKSGASMALSLELVTIPLIILLVWQSFLFFHIPVKKAIKVAIINILSFYILQLFFLLLIYGYENKFWMAIYELLLNNFAIIVLFIIIKDYLLQKLSFKKIINKEKTN